MGNEIRGIVGSLERNNPDLSATARLKRAWNASVNQAIRDHVTAVFVVPNTSASEVIIYVDSAIWATELTMQAEILRLNLNLELNRYEEEHERVSSRVEKVESLRFKVSKEQYISKDRRKSTIDQLEEEQEALRRVNPVELSDEELSSIQIATSGMENDALREIAYAAAKANLEWQKGLNQRGA